MARKPANKNENEAAQAVEEVVQTAEEKAEETVTKMALEWCTEAFSGLGYNRFACYSETV